MFQRGHSHFAPLVNSLLSGAQEEEDAPGQAGRMGTIGSTGGWYQSIAWLPSLSHPPAELGGCG